MMTKTEDCGAMCNCDMSTSFTNSSEQNFVHGNMPGILMIVRCNKLCWDKVIVTSCSAVSQQSQANSHISGLQGQNPSTDQWNDYSLSIDNSGTKIKDLNKNGICLKNKVFSVIRYKLEGIHFSVFLRELMCSKIYRLLVIKNLLKKLERKTGLQTHFCVVHWNLQDNLPCIIDYEWNIRMTRNVRERQHLDTAMSWLSTLGGAFSALGDYDSEFAKRAGNTSFQQMDIALRIGDPGIVARCRLYISISLIQQRKFKIAALIIKHEYQWAYSLPSDVRDQRLINMCHGIWTKLRYERKINKHKNGLLTSVK